MAEVSSLDDVLSDEPKAPPEPPASESTTGEPPAAPEVERVTSRRAAHRAKELAAQGRGPDGKFLPKEDAPAAPAAAAAPAAEPAKAEPKAPPPPAQEMTDKEKAAFAAAADERRKRQALEAELAKYRGAQPSPAQPPAGATAAEKKAFWDDPEGFLNEWRTKTLSEAQQSNVNTRLQTAEMLARYRYKEAGDFDANIAVFSELVQQTPGLAQQWLASPDPAEFAYRAGKTHRELREVGSVDAMREKMEKELRTKIEAEFKAKQEEERKLKGAIPPSLSDVKGAVTQQRTAFTGPTPLEAILKP